VKIVYHNTVHFVGVALCIKIICETVPRTSCVG